MTLSHSSRNMPILDSWKSTASNVPVILQILFPRPHYPLFRPIGSAWNAFARSLRYAWYGKILGLAQHAPPPPPQEKGEKGGGGVINSIEMRPWPYYNCLIWVGGTIPFWWGSSSRLGTQISSASPPDPPGNRASRSYILTGLLQTSTFLPPDQPQNRASRSYILTDLLQTSTFSPHTSQETERRGPILIDILQTWTFVKTGAKLKNEG